MVNINLEDMQDVQVNTVLGDVIEVKLISKSGSEVVIRTTKEKAGWMQEELERVVVDEPYRYESMQKENDMLQHRVEELEELLHNLGYQEAV